MSRKLKMILMSYIFVEQRASCFAGSAGNGIKFQNFKSWSSEQQFPHSEITSGPKWKPPTWSFITQAGFRKRPCRTSSLELPFFTAAFPSILNLSSLHWGFFTHSPLKKCKSTRHSGSMLSSEGARSSHGSGCLWVSAIFFILFSSFVFESSSHCIYFMRFFFLSGKIPSCPLTRVKPRIVELYPVSPAT